MTQLLPIKNLTLDQITRGSIAHRLHSTEISVPDDFGISKGDVLAVADSLSKNSRSSLHFALAVDWIRDTYRSYRLISCLPASRIAKVSRNGHQVTAELQCHGSIIGDKALDGILIAAAGADSPLSRAQQIKDHLSQVLELLPDTELDLKDALTTYLDQHQGALRVVTRQGSGVAVQDQIEVTALGSATVQNIDRQSLPALEILTCTAPQQQPKKSRWSL